MTRRAVLTGWSAQLLGRAASVAASIISVGVLSRQLGAEGFGTWTAVAAWVTLMAPLADLGVPAVLLRDAKGPDFESELASALGLHLVLAVPALVLATASGSLVLSGRPGGALVLGLASASLLPTALYGLVQQAFAVRRRFVVTASAEAAVRVVTAVVTVAVVRAGVGMPWLVLLLALPAVLGCLTLLVVARSLSLPLPRPRLEPARARALLARGLPIAASLALFAVYLRLDAVLLSVLSTQADVGLYGLAYRVVEAVLAVPALFMVVAYPALAAVKDEPAEFSRLTTLCARGLALVAGGVLVVAGTVAPAIMVAIGGTGFRRGGGALALLLVSAAWSVGTALLGQVLILSGRTGYLLRFSACNVTANLALNMVLIPRFGVEGAAVATVLTEAAAVLVVGRRVSRLGLLQVPGRSVAVALSGAALAVGVFHLLSGAGEPLGLLAALGTYALVVLRGADLGGVQVRDLVSRRG